MRQWAGIPSSSSISVSGIWNMGPIRSLVTGVIVKRWLKPRKWFEWAFNRRSGCRRTHVPLQLRFSVQGLTNASCLRARCFRFPGHLLIGSRPLTSCLKHHGRQNSKCCQSQLDSTGAIKPPVTFSDWWQTRSGSQQAWLHWWKRRLSILNARHLPKVEPLKDQIKIAFGRSSHERTGAGGGVGRDLTTRHVAKHPLSRRFTRCLLVLYGEQRGFHRHWPLRLKIQQNPTF